MNSCGAEKIAAFPRFQKNRTVFGALSLALLLGVQLLRCGLSCSSFLRGRGAVRFSFSQVSPRILVAFQTQTQNRSILAVQLPKSQPCPPGVALPKRPFRTKKSTESKFTTARKKRYGNNKTLQRVLRSACSCRKKEAGKRYGL